ncbi:hypothetical protein [Thermoactinomyces sp. CICC 24227]|jgi:hypothetical protein|uniref:hypothetical protein n=1 Tax=Thermoactinomyces sp. CICC 24227 TaxID=2767432 RepID=UPI0018DE21AC|nr:hypothetical protein [Thermoactinomyces sp. CICC 24227]MBI0387800.1 hypothetical protein [Thermoactinomyces sp. CICC 24227]
MKKLIFHNGDVIESYTLLNDRVEVEFRENGVHIFSDYRVNSVGGIVTPFIIIPDNIPNTIPTEVGDPVEPLKRYDMTEQLTVYKYFWD